MTDTKPDLIERARGASPPRRRVMWLWLLVVVVVAAAGVLAAVLLWPDSDEGDSELAAPVATTAPVEEPTATSGFACPPGATPDQPGPRNQNRPEVSWPNSVAPATFDPGSGRMLLFNYNAFWMFDVCTNTWTEAPSLEEEWASWIELVYDVDSDSAVMFGPVYDEDEDEDKDFVVADVWAYEPATQTWTRKSDRVLGPTQDWGWVLFEPELKAVYDPVTGLVLVRGTLASGMWTYDVDTDTWAEVDQGDILPPSFAEDGPHGEVLTYDASVDRLILYVGSSGPERYFPGTWEFDIRAGRWEKPAIDTPELSVFGWPSGGDEFLYDEANQVSVLFSADSTLGRYDASAHRWTIHQSPIDPDFYDSGLGAPMAYDPVNERILVAEQPRGVSDGVVTFDVATGESITVLEPSRRFPGGGGWYVIGGVLALAFLGLVAALAMYGRRWQDEPLPS